MPFPATAIPWSQSMDPYDRRPWIMDVASQLEEGETIETFDLELSPEAMDAGLLISTGSGRDPVLVNDLTAIMLWFEVATLDQDDAMFSGAGITFPVELSVRTNAIPQNRFQLTYLLRVAQK